MEGGPEKQKMVHGERQESRELKEAIRADAAVILGGELRRLKNGEVVAGLESKMRALGGLELLRRDLIKKIILTGGITKEFPKGPSIARAMADYLIKKGAPEEAVVIGEEESKNTAENIEKILETLEKEDVKSVLLETNEFHLRRATQLLGNIFEKHGIRVESGYISAEELLDERSPHYQKLTSHYKFPDSLKNAPEAALKKGLREFLRRILIHVDRDDKIAKFLASKLR